MTLLKLLATLREKCDAVMRSKSNPKGFGNTIKLRENPVLTQKYRLCMVTCIDTECNCFGMVII